ncbi:MAG: MauE/DoxX family redox-associated membrane protein [Pseudomonadota bacterium]
MNRKTYVSVGLKLVLGLTFIGASYHKLLLPAEFAKIIYGYYLFPEPTINLLAIVVPYLELISGLALITGIYSRPGLIIINGFLIGFIIAISINILRGHQFDCGCFSFSEPDHVSSAVWLLIRDIGLLAGGIYLWFQMSPYGADRLNALQDRRV